MFSNNVTLTVVVNGQNGGEHIAREYVSLMNRQTYVEGREGSNFTLRLKNNNAFRVLAIPSVDGLSILDGKPAGAKSSGYVLEAYQTYDIPGWTVDTGTVAKFFFAGMRSDGSDASYAAQSGADTANKGVIGLKVFREKYKPVLRPTFTANNAMPLSATRGVFSKGIRGSSADYNADQSFSTCASPLGGSSATASMNATLSASMVGATTQTATQTLGTGFGDAADFRTTKTEFERGDLLAMIVLYYNDARELKKVGIDVSKPASVKPSAFPADDLGCAPPAGWTR